MILPIIAYGDSILKKKCKTISNDYPKLKELIENMHDTMYNASGIGLAAPQIGASIRLFIVDTVQLENDENEGLKGIQKVFINPEILEETGEKWKYEEGCLSIPGVRGDVYRQPDLKIKYQDENFEWQEETFDDINARVIQHEFDHIEGVLFTDKIDPLKKKLVRNKLKKIMKGDVQVDYRMKFPQRKN